ncbi:VOC family protein [Gordonia sp. VNK21]|uniref:VOC family protein n=1 Tax=Gordonia sp. VNK21 TaxID=3382483 RepID=UPI0038D3A4C7
MTEVFLHHVHLVTADISGFCKFFEKHFGAEVVFDDAIDNDRNVFLKIGTGRVHLFESRRPPAVQRNLFHHIGMMVDDLQSFSASLIANGIGVTPITETAGGRFAMTQGPDGLLIELFEVSDPEARRAFVE